MRAVLAAAVVLAACAGGDGGGGSGDAVACVLSEDQVEEATGMTIEEKSDEPTRTDFGSSCSYDGTFGLETGLSRTDRASVVIRVYDDERGAEIFDETHADGGDLTPGVVTDGLDMAMMYVGDRYISASIRHELPRNFFGSMAEILEMILAETGETAEAVAARPPAESEGDGAGAGEEPDSEPPAPPADEEDEDDDRADGEFSISGAREEVVTGVAHAAHLEETWGFLRISPDETSESPDETSEPAVFTMWFPIDAEETTYRIAAGSITVAKEQGEAGIVVAASVDLDDVGHFDRFRDPEGTLEITSADGGTLSGHFRFTATNPDGEEIVVKGSFDDVAYEPPE